MDAATSLKLNQSTARTKVLLDANVLIYAQEAFKATGIHLLNYLEDIRGRGIVDWFVGSCIVVNLHNAGTYNLSLLAPRMLNCQDIGMKMNQFPYIKADSSLGFVKLNSLAGDDWAQIGLAHNNPDLIIVTNDSAMFKTAHAVLEGRAIAFHDFLQKISPNWTVEPGWLKLKKWLIDNKKPLRNNSSWIIPGQRKWELS